MSPAATVTPEAAAVLRHRGGVLRVVGGPGSGKTTLAAQAVGERVRQGADLGRCLVLTPTRLSAAAMRDRLGGGLTGSVREPLARSMQSFGFHILRTRAAWAGDGEPRLLSGPEQDMVLADLLAGHRAGDVPAPPWPSAVGEAISTKAIRGELRDLFMRVAEREIGPRDLAALGERFHRPEWIAAAQVLAEYEAVTALASPTAYDPASVLGAAAGALLEDDELAAQVRSRLELVVVDDAQELTLPGRRLLEVLVAPGLDLILIGDPDCAVHTFRGADPGLFLQPWSQGAPDRELVVLSTQHRLPSTLAEVASRVRDHIGVVGSARHRQVGQPSRRGGSAEVLIARSPGQEAALVVDLVTDARYRDGRQWSEIAVITRGGARSVALRRELLAAGVPVASGLAELPLAAEPVARALLLLLELSLTLAHGADQPDEAVAVDLLTSVVGGADPLSIRRLRRALRRQELADGGSRHSGELLAATLVDAAMVDGFGVEADPVRRIAAALEASRQVLARHGPAATAHLLLWELWRALGWADPWRDAALRGGPDGIVADRMLDAVVALMDEAREIEERLPGAGARTFLEQVTSLAVPGDRLSARAVHESAVEILTPASAAGRSWPLVIVAGVQEGAWPDRRLRGLLLGSGALVDAVAGREHSWRSSAQSVLHDELRLFHVAVSRASEALVALAVDSQDDQPSVLLDQVAAPPDAGRRPYAEGRHRLQPAAAVADARVRLRRTGAAADSAIADLAAMARVGIRGAHPRSWWALREVTDARPVHAPERPVPVSPSQVDAFERCALRWLLTTHGGRGPAVGAASLGSLVHGVAADVGERGIDAMRAELDRRWGELGLRGGWIEARKRREADAMLERLERYLSHARAAGWKPAAIERSFQVTVGRAEIRGQADRVEVSPDGVVRIIDYKTGSTAVRTAEVARHGQLGAYQVAVEAGGMADLGTRSGGAALVQLGKAGGASFKEQRQEALAQDSDPSWAHRLVNETASGMAAATFQATPSTDGCRTCPVRSSCPAQPEGGGIG